MSSNHVANYGKIINEIKDLHDKKNADYAGSEDSLANLAADRLCHAMHGDRAAGSRHMNQVQTTN